MHACAQPKCVSMMCQGRRMWLVLLLRGCVHACIQRYTSVAQRWPEADKCMSRQEYVAIKLVRCVVAGDGCKG